MSTKTTTRIAGFHLNDQQILGLLSGRLRLSEASRKLFEDSKPYKFVGQDTITRVPGERVFPDAPEGTDDHYRRRDKPGMIQMAVFSPAAPEVVSGGLLPLIELEFEEVR